MFIFTNALRYFIFTEEAYAAYFWPRVNWVFPHLVCVIIALLAGPFQFSNRLRAKYLKWHKRSRYLYLIAILFGAIAGIGLSLTSQVNLTYKFGLFFLAIAWLLNSGMALICILKRKIEQHREWMIRSYVVTFAFVFFRLFADIFTTMKLLKEQTSMALLVGHVGLFPFYLQKLFYSIKEH